MSGGPPQRGLVGVRRSRRVAAGVGVAAVLLAAGAAVVFWRPRPPAPPVSPDVDLTGADPAVVALVESARAAVGRAPGSGDAWGRLGMVLAAHGIYPESVVCLTEAQRCDPGEPRWPYFRGVIVALGDPESAVPHLRRAVELFELGADAPRLRLAEVLLGQARTDEAEELFRQVLARDPGSPRAHLGLGRAAYLRADWAGSLAHLRRAADSALTQQRARSLLAEVERRRGAADAAEREQRVAADLPPDPEPLDPVLEELERFRVGRQARLARASTRLKQGRAAEAVALLGELVRDYPDSTSAWLGLGRALVQQGNYPAAERALRQAARLDANRVEVQFYLGVALFQQGRTSDATTYFRRATELRPDHALAQYNLGQCLKAQGEREAAIEAFRAAVRYKPHHAQAHLSLGELLAQEGDREPALQHLRLAVDLDPSEARAKELLRQYER
jgi:tetratricopeptide (TPR) repeat protein